MGDGGEGAAALGLRSMICGKKDREHRNIVDDLIDRDEPALLHVRVRQNETQRVIHHPALHFVRRHQERSDRQAGSQDRWSGLPLLDRLERIKQHDDV